MTVHLDTRPSGVDLMFRPGNIFTLELTWPQSLSGRTFVSTLSSQNLSLTYSVSEMTIQVTGTQSDDYEIDTPLDWALSESGDDLLIGTWVPSFHPSALTLASVSVSNGVQSVTVSYASNLNLVTSLSGINTAIESLSDGIGVVHDWTQEGWTPWTTRLINQSDTSGSWTQQTLQVTTDGRGRITGTPQNIGNNRLAYERHGTTWLNSEVQVLWMGASIFSNTSTGALPQQGQFHRAYIDENGIWRGVVITNNIFLSDVNTVNQNVWNSTLNAADTTNALMLGSNGGNKTFSNSVLRRSMSIYAMERFSFLGSFLQIYRCAPTHLYSLSTGTPVVVDASTGSYDIAVSALPLGVDYEFGTVTFGTTHTTTDSPPIFGTGTIVPTAESAKRYWPYWVKSQLVDRDLRVKVWRYNETEPDWADERYVVHQNFSTTDPQSSGEAGDPEPGASWPENAGACGVVGAHLRNSHYMDYGYFHAREL